MLASFHRWMFETLMLETLRDWIVRETEFQAIAAEAIKGITTNQTKKSHSNGSIFSFLVWMAEEDTFIFLSKNVDDDFNYTKRIFFEEDIDII